MKVKSQQRDSSRAFRTLMIFFKLVGLATFTRRAVTQKKKSLRTLCTFKYSELGIVYNTVLVSLMIASNYLSIPYIMDASYENKTNLTVGIEVLQGVLGTVVICALLFSYCIGQKSAVRIVNRLTDIEHELDQLYRLYPSLRRRRVFRVLTAVCVSNGCLAIVLVISEYIAFQTSPVSWLTDIVPTFHVGWYMIQYFLLVTVIQADFADVNRAIQSLCGISTPDLQPQSFYQMRRIVVSSTNVHQVLQLREMHCHLCDISEQVADFYSLPILFGFAFMFLTLIYNGYYLISPLLLTDEILEYNVLANTIFWLIFLIYPILLLTTRITKILEEMGRTGTAVHSLLSCAVGNEAKSEVKMVTKFSQRLSVYIFVITTFIVDLLQLKQFSLQLLHRKIQFTANGYFTLDNTLFHSMIGAVTTYLVILVQFQMGTYSTTPYCNCT